MNVTVKAKEWTADEVRELRVSRGMSLEQAAKRIRVKPRTWLSWELPSQKRRPPASKKMLLDMLESQKI